MFHLLISHIDINLNSHVTILFGFIFFHCLSYVLLAPKTKTVKKMNLSKTQAEEAGTILAFTIKMKKPPTLHNFIYVRFILEKGNL